MRTVLRRRSKASRCRRSRRDRRAARPSRISTAPTLIAPIRIARRTAMPSVDDVGDAAAVRSRGTGRARPSARSGRSSIRMRRRRRWFWRRPGRAARRRSAPAPRRGRRRPRATARDSVPVAVTGPIADLGGHAERRGRRRRLSGTSSSTSSCAEVDDRHERRVGGDHRAVGDRQRADHAVDRRADLELGDPALELGDRQALALVLLLHGLEVEARRSGRPGAATARACSLRTSRGLDRVVRALELDLGDRAELARPARRRSSSRVRRGRARSRPRRPRGARCEPLLARRAIRALPSCGLELLQGRLLAVRARCSARATRGGASTSPCLTVSPARIASVTVPGDRRVQRRADGGDHAAGDRGVADQRAAGDLARSAGGRRRPSARSRASAAAIAASAATAAIRRPARTTAASGAAGGSAVGRPAAGSRTGVGVGGQGFHHLPR